MNLKLLSLSIISLSILSLSCESTKTQTDSGIKQKNIMDDWNEAHNNKTDSIFYRIYDDQVNYYGSTSSRQQVAQSKKQFLKRHSDFTQKISNLKEINSGDSVITYTFSKTVTMENKTSIYPSYLITRKKSNRWYIIAESDSITDKNLAKINSDNPKEYQYEPSISELYGIIHKETHYGPPGYGENPEEDMKEEVLILELSANIKVIADKNSKHDFNETKEAINKIQITSTKDVTLEKYIDKKVKVTGTLFGAQTGHHFTEVLMDINKIEEK